MLNGIYFSATAESAGIAPGDAVDAAFIPQINEYRGERTVQLNIQDLRPCCRAACSEETAAYRAFRAGTLSPDAAGALLPDRKTMAVVWKYLDSASGPLRETPVCLCRKIVRWSGLPLDVSVMLTCLDIFSDVGLVKLQRARRYITILLTPRQGGQKKADLNQSQTLRRLLQAKES